MSYQLFGKLLISLLLTALLVVACATYRGWAGWAETDLSWLQVGMARDKVEGKLGKPIDIRVVEQGILVAYEYDRGWIPPAERDPRKKALAPVVLVADVMSAGTLALISEPQKACQKGWLRVLYNKTSNIVAVKECLGQPKQIDCDQDVRQYRRPSTLPKKFTDEPTIELDCDFRKRIHIDLKGAHESTAE